MDVCTRGFAIVNQWIFLCFHRQFSSCKRQAYLLLPTKATTPKTLPAVSFPFIAIATHISGNHFQIKHHLIYILLQDKPGKHATAFFNTSIHLNKQS